jgi:hypothetical protein
MKTPPDLMTFLIMFKITQTMEALEVAEKQYYTSRDVADITGFSLRWVVAWRHKIVGSKRMGRLWRFDKDMVDARIRIGKDVRVGF